MNKKAILVVSYGTTYKETVARTIEKIEESIRSGFHKRAFYRAWTSKFVVSKIKERDGVEIDTPEKAIARMIEDGVTDVIVQPTHLTEGKEYDTIIKTFDDAGKDFDSVKIGKPLLADDDDMEFVAMHLLEEYVSVKEGSSALVLMGHGTPGRRSTVYENLQAKFRDHGYANAFIGAMDGEPGIDEMLDELKQSGANYDKVYLAPLLLVAGKHAVKDMAGEDEDTWESRLKASGYNVEPNVIGLGEYDWISELSLDHARDALGK